MDEQRTKLNPIVMKELNYKLNLNNIFIKTASKDFNEYNLKGL